MPAVAVPWIVAGITAAATTTAAVMSSRANTSSSRTAAQSEQAGIDKQLQYEREMEATRKTEQDRVDTEEKARWEATQKQLEEDRAKEQARYDSERQERDTERATAQAERDALRAERQAQFDLEKQQYLEKEARMAPYRAAGASALASLASRSGIAAPSMARPEVLTTMPENWQAGDPVTTATTKATAQASSPSLLDNPELLPVTATDEPRAASVLASEATAETKPTVGTAAFMSEAAYQPLVEGPSDALASLTPEQIAALKTVAPTLSLSALAKARKAKAKV